MKINVLNEIRGTLIRLYYKKLVSIKVYPGRCNFYDYKSNEGIHCSFADWGDDKTPILKIGIGKENILIINDPSINDVIKTLPNEQLQLFELN